jgi:Sigma 54 modulation/S30EA ribosomal protein C terminus
MRPAEERESVRRKSFALAGISIDEVADALEDLDHDFLLFHDARMDADAVVYWRHDGLIAVIEPRSIQLPEETRPLVEQSDSPHQLIWGRWWYR